jgi:hypothetical protein
MWLSSIGFFLFFNTLPITGIGPLGLANEGIEGNRQIGSCPEVFDAIGKTVVIETMKNVGSPTKFVGCFFELDSVTMNVARFLHFEHEDFGGSPSLAIRITED